MKKYLFIAVLFSSIVFGQFKDPAFPTENVKDGIVNNSSDALFGFLNSDNFTMRHSYNMSYSSFGGNGLALGVYTNSMMYQFSEDLNVQLDASFIHSPYSSFGKDFQNDITGFAISRGAINYRPWKDVHISLQYNRIPNSYFYSPFNSYFGGGGYGWNNSFYDPFGIR